MRLYHIAVRLVEHVVEFVDDTCSQQFEHRFFAGPQGGKRGVGMRRPGYLLLFGGVHGLLYQGGRCATYLLHIDAYGLTAQRYRDGFLGVGDAELQVVAVRDKGLAVLVEDKLRMSVVKRRLNGSDEFEQHRVRLKAAETPVGVLIA